MEAVTHHSIKRASEEAVRIWGLTSAQYPKRHEIILNLATASIIESVSAFALNARRVLEVLPKDRKFPLAQTRWDYELNPGHVAESDLWDALNRIIHARELRVGFESLPNHLSFVNGGALVVPYVAARTDRKSLAFVDLFALAHAYLYDLLPLLNSEGQPEEKVR